MQENGKRKWYGKCDLDLERQNHMFSLICGSQVLIIEYTYLGSGNYGLRPRNLKEAHKIENGALREEAGGRNRTHMI